MPPRKSNVSAVSNGADEAADTTPAKAPKDGMSVEDLSLPKSMIARLAKGVLPANTSIQKDALLALHKSATVFVNYITSNANELTQAGGKKTIMPPEVMTALKDAEFEDFLPRLEAELKKYNDIQCDKRNTYRRKVKEEKAAATVPDANGEDSAMDATTSKAADAETNGHADDDDAARPFKKFKAQNGTAVAPEANGIDESMDAMDDDTMNVDADETVEDEGDDDDQVEEEIEMEDQDEDGDDQEDEDDASGLVGTSGMRDEALDGSGSDSD